MTLATSLALAAAIKFCSSALISASSLPFGGSATDALQIAKANAAAAKQYLSPRIANPPLQSQTYTPQSVFMSRKRDGGRGGPVPLNSMAARIEFQKLGIEGENPQGRERSNPF